MNVASVTVTDFLNENGIKKVDLMKMDIEGAEKLAFKSAHEWLSRVDWLIVEVHFVAMSLTELVRIVASQGRRVFMKTARPSTEWVEVPDESYSIIESKFPSLDVLIPPAKAATYIQ